MGLRVEVEYDHRRHFLRKVIGVLGVFTVAASAVLTVSPSAFASPAININVPQIQGFTSHPFSYFMENQPDEYRVTMQSGPITATSTPQTTTTYTPTTKQVDTQVAHTSQTWVNTSHYVSYQYYVNSGHYATGERWVTSGHYATGERWVTSGYYQSYQYYVNSGYWQPYRYCSSGIYGWRWFWVPNYVLWRGQWHQSGYKRVEKWVEVEGPRCYYAHRWINTSHYATGERWVNTSHNVSYQYWVNTSHNVSYQYWVNTSHYATGERWVTSGYDKTTTYYTTLVTYETIMVPTVTTVSAQGLHITGAQLEGVLPGIRDVTPGSPYDGQEYWAGNAGTDGGFCDGGTTPLISPSNPDFPDYSSDLPEYTQYFESKDICTFNPTLIQGNNVQNWQLNGDHAALLLQAKYQVTVSYTLTTTVNGKVTSQVPQTQTQDVWSPVYTGPTWPIYAVTGVSCTVNNGMEYCPGHAPFPADSGTYAFKSGTNG